MASLFNQFWIKPLLAAIRTTRYCLQFVPSLFGVKAVYLWTDRLIFVLVARCDVSDWSISVPASIYVSHGYRCFDSDVQ